jgi:hypothetical protein
MRVALSETTALRTDWQTRCRLPCAQHAVAVWKLRDSPRKLLTGRLDWDPKFFGGVAPERQLVAPPLEASAAPALRGSLR